MHHGARSVSNSPVHSTFTADSDFAELLQMFAEAVPEKQSTLQTLYGAGDLEQLKVQAHQLKGAAGGYGFPGLCQAALELEQACVENAPGAVAEKLAALVRYLDRIAV